MDLSSKSVNELLQLAKLHNIYVPSLYRNRKTVERQIYKNVNLKIASYHLNIFLDIHIDSEFIHYTSNCLSYVNHFLTSICSICFDEMTFSYCYVDKIKKDRIRIVLHRKYPFTNEELDFCEGLYNKNYINLQELILNPSEYNLQKFILPENFTFDLRLERIYQTIL